MEGGVLRPRVRRDARRRPSVCQRPQHTFGIGIVALATDGGEDAGSIIIRSKLAIRQCQRLNQGSDPLPIGGSKYSPFLGRARSRKSILVACVPAIDFELLSRDWHHHLQLGKDVGTPVIAHQMVDDVFYFGILQERGVFAFLPNRSRLSRGRDSDSRFSLKHMDLASGASCITL